MKTMVVSGRSTLVEILQLKLARSSSLIPKLHPRPPFPSMSTVFMA